MTVFQNSNGNVFHLNSPVNSPLLVGLSEGFSEKKITHNEPLTVQTLEQSNNFAKLLFCNFEDGIMNKEILRRKCALLHIGYSCISFHILNDSRARGKCSSQSEDFCAQLCWLFSEYLRSKFSRVQYEVRRGNDYTGLKISVCFWHCLTQYFVHASVMCS